MLDYYVSISTVATNNTWWQRLRPRLIALYLIVALGLLFLSATGHVRLLNEVGRTFGGFFWAIDTDGRTAVVSTLPQSAALNNATNSLSDASSIIGVRVTNASGIDVYKWPNQRGPQSQTVPLEDAYQHAQEGDSITYTILHSNNTKNDVAVPAVKFSLDMWWQSYGLALLAGISWLLVGAALLITAKDWMGAVEGITLLPPAMLFLLYSHWGNVQIAYPADIVFQLLWVPSFALLGAAFIHLSLTYRPEAMHVPRRPRLMVDGLPYLPLIALIAFEWGSYLLMGRVAARPHFIVAIGYGVMGGVISFGIGINSLLHIGGILPRILPRKSPRVHITDNIRRRLGDLLTLWIGGIGLGFCLGILPILLTGQTLIPLQVFDTLAIVYPLLLFYAIRSLRLVERLEVTLAQREEALSEQQKTAEELRQANTELKQATSLLLHADARLRSVLSQRIHDQPKQQALRIRSLLGHWQHKLKTEAAHDPAGKVAAQPITEVLGKVRKISEELEGDLRKLQLLVEDSYQRRSLGLKLHLEKLIREDLPSLHLESPLKVKPDLMALDIFSHDLEQTDEGAKMAEAISYTITQALLNVYNHAGASTALVRTLRINDHLEVYITDDGRGFDVTKISPEKTSMFKALLMAREADGTLSVQSIPRPQAQHGTTVMLRLPIPTSHLLP